MQISNTTTVPAPMELSTWLPSFNSQHTRRLYDSDQARMLVEYNGLDSIDAVFALLDKSVHQHKSRSVSRVMLEQPDGKPVEVFVKMHWGVRRLVPRWTVVRTGQAFLSHPDCEWNGNEALRSLGLFIPERLALLKRGWLWFQDAILIKRVHPEFSLDELIRSGAWDDYSADDRGVILEAVVHVMQRIHKKGLGWRGTCTRHFFPSLIGGGFCQLWLIDCEGVHRHVTHRDIARDFRKLYRAFEISGADSQTLRQFQLLAEKSQASHAQSAIRKARLVLASHLKSSLKTPA